MASARPEIHQFLPVLDEGDAIGNEAKVLQRLLRDAGYRSEIFVWRAGKGQKGYCRHYSRHRALSSPDNVMLYHFSVCCPITAYFASVPGRKVMVYHNITPAEFFAGIAEEVYYITKKGRRELDQLAPAVDLALPVSEYNARELREAGYRRVETVPLVVDYDAFDTAPDGQVLRRLNDGRTNLLFVGRLSPNKKQEDLIRVFYHFKRIDSNARLLLVGSARQVPRYKQLLDELVTRLGIEDVVIAGGVSHAALVAYYKSASAFVCLSEHEGFCVPLIEAMRFDLPVIAFDSSAVAETLSGAGVLVREKRHAAIAELVNLVVKDEVLRDRIVAGQRRRCEQYAYGVTSRRFMDTLTSFVEQER
ncbi:MAG: glycosyltransferase family 4 protein [Verrucomicrobia bacterium]|nr:glycosyltransferase family 4 protein [Verrucomicrobiota bacterium]